MKAKLYIRGTIGSYWAGTTAEETLDFLERNKDVEVDIIICSPGGFVADGLEIYQAIKRHGKCRGHIVGMTASIATVIAMGCSTLDMAKSSLILAHNSSTLVSAWNQLNKEQLDRFIDSCKKKRDELNTIDDLIASIYSDKNGKTIAENIAMMNEAKWITAAKALELGLIDEISKDEKTANISATTITNSMDWKALGLPVIESDTIIDVPQQQTTANTSAAEVAEGKSLTQESFLQKIIGEIKSMFKNEKVTNTEITMNKNYKNIISVLAVAAIAVADGKANLSEEDLGKIEEALDKAATEKANLEKELKEANDKISEKDEEIKQLKGSAGGSTLQELTPMAGEQPNMTLAQAMYKSLDF
ncbi:MAG: Clp protease ClpP [Prevotella sp.]